MSESAISMPFQFYPVHACIQAVLTQDPGTGCQRFLQVDKFIKAIHGRIDPFQEFPKPDYFRPLCKSGESIDGQIRSIDFRYKICRPGTDHENLSRKLFFEQ